MPELELQRKLQKSGVSGTGGYMRAVVVEDDPSIAWVERQALERDGFDVSVATSGSQAVRMIRTVRPDVIILDHLLPDMDGMDVIRQIRATSSAAIIVVTARTE